MKMNKNIKYLIALCALLLISKFASAQFYTLGNDPARAKWRQIETENYTLIYPQEIDSLARRYLYLLESRKSKVMEPLEINPRKIPVVLHPYSTLSNGMVSWAPRRMELYTTPDAYDGNADLWDEHLVIHESRHVGQIEAFEIGFWKAMKYVLGDQIIGLVVGLYPTGVFLEGDAVVAETVYTKTGRGRNAEFQQYMRMALINGDYRSWERYRFGSYRHFTPNEYVMGYFEEYNNAKLSNNYFYPGEYIKNLVDKWYNPSVISSAAADLTGVNKYIAFDTLVRQKSREWKSEMEQRGKLTVGEKLNLEPKRLHTDYRYPTPIYDKETGERRVYAIKDGMEQNDIMVYIDEQGREHHVRNFSQITSKLSVDRNNIIYWSETIKRNAATLEDFSVIRSFDPFKNKLKKYKGRTRYYNPSPSLGGDSIAVVEYPIVGSSYALILDRESGDLIFRVEAPGKGQIKEVTWVGDRIYCSVTNERGLGIYTYNAGAWEEVIAPQYRTIKGLTSQARSLYFTSDLDGLQNIYCFDLDSSTLTRLSNSAYGASDIALGQDSLIYYSDYQLKGYDINSLQLSAMDATKMDFEKPTVFEEAEFMTEQMQQQSKFKRSQEDALDVYDTAKYPSKRYGKLSHLFRFHSWAPIYYDVDRIRSMSYESFYDIASLGFTSYSQNSLGTAQTMLAYSYKNGFHAGHAKFSYSGLGPTIELSAEVNTRNAMNYKLGSSMLGNYLSMRPMLDKTYANTSILVYYPLNLYGNGWSRGFIPQFRWSLNNDSYYSYDLEYNAYAHIMQYGFRYYQMLPIAKSALYPRWGYSVSVMGLSVPSAGENFGNALQISSYAYFPGLTRSQGLRLGLEYQRQFSDGKNYRLSFSDLPRGYTFTESGRTIPNDYYYKATLDYAVPIYLGDLDLNNILYLKRLRFIPFADYAYNYNNIAHASHLYSYGADLLLDFFVLKLYGEVSVGLRYARTGPQQGASQNYFQFLFNIVLP